MLRANTAKFAGKILKLNRLNFRFLGSFDAKNSKLATAIHIGSLKWRQSFTWLFWLTNRNQLDNLPSSTRPLFNKTLADALFSSSVKVWILDIPFWFRRMAIIALHASVAYPLLQKTTLTAKKNFLQILQCSRATFEKVLFFWAIQSISVKNINFIFAIASVLPFYASQTS